MGGNDSKRSSVVNEFGENPGKAHPRAKLTDHEIDLIRELHESGMSYEQIAKKFEGKGYVRYIARRVEA